MNKFERKKIFAYYFPNWHVDPMNEKWHGPGWTEWNLVKCATPRFPGHKQPKVPLWGYGDESEPAEMAKKIDAAVRHGVDGFMFDWYYYGQGPYRNRCLDEGFLNAANVKDIEFAVMWCNHSAIQAHPGSRMFRTPELCSGTVDAETFRAATEHCIKNYFNHPSYLRIDGKLYFSIYSLPKMVQELGGVAAARALFDDFRYRVEKAGLGQLHLNAVNLENMSAPDVTDPEKVNSLTGELGLDSRSGHAWTWTEPDFPCRKYALVAKSNMDKYPHYWQDFKLRYNPVVCVGWDPSPRTVQSEVYENIGYPFTSILSENTPEEFEKVLRRMLEFMESDIYTGDLLFLHSWNEWTEGTYLEPDTEYGYGHLEAVRNVFGLS